MWSSLAALARSTRGQKLLQIFLTMPFLTDRYASCTQILVQLCCCFLSCKPFPQCASTSWCRGDSNLMTVNDKNIGLKAHIGVQPALHSLCLVCLWYFFFFWKTQSVFLVIFLVNGFLLVAGFFIFFVKG